MSKKSIYCSYFHHCNSITHCFILCAEHRHGNCGHQSWAGFLLHLKRRTFLIVECFQLNHRTERSVSVFCDQVLQQRDKYSNYIIQDMILSRKSKQQSTQHFMQYIILYLMFNVQTNLNSKVMLLILSFNKTSKLFNTIISERKTKTKTAGREINQQ